MWRKSEFNNDMKSAIQTLSTELFVSKDSFQSEERSYLIYPMRKSIFLYFFLLL